MVGASRTGVYTTCPQDLPSFWDQDRLPGGSTTCVHPRSSAFSLGPRSCIKWQPHMVLGCIHACFMLVQGL